MTRRRKILRIACLTLLLVGGIALCAVRWQAWFGNPPEPALTGDTIAYRFRTFADSATYAQRPQTPDYQILILGDVHNSLTRADYQKIADEAGNLAAYAQLGDCVERCYLFYFQQLYRELQGTPFDSLPLINCPGNHEYRKGLRRSLPDLWYQNFPQPLNGPQDFLGSTYYIDFPNLRFIVLDTNGMQWLHEYMRTLTWLNGVCRRQIRGGDDAPSRLFLRRWTLQHHYLHHLCPRSAKGRPRLCRTRPQLRTPLAVRQHQRCNEVLPQQGQSARYAHRLRLPLL
mgnify:CR=1 FL=1